MGYDEDDYGTPGKKVKNPFPDDTPEYDIWDKIRNAEDNLESYAKYAQDYAQKMEKTRDKVNRYRIALAKLTRKDEPDGQEPPRPNRGRQDRRNRVRTADISIGGD